MKEELMELINLIKKMEDMQVRARVDIEAGERRYADERLALVNQIASEKTGEGKAVYSNADKREVRLKELMNDSHPLYILRCQLREDRVKSEYARNELMYLRRKLRVYEILSRQ